MKIVTTCFRIIRFLFFNGAGFCWRILKKFSLVFYGIGFGLFFVFAGHEGLRLTSTDEFCNLCHVHPHVTYSWKKSTHYKNESGVVIHCVECHLPAGGFYYFSEKARLGIRDVYGTVLKDVEAIDWDAKSVLERAITYTYDSSCLKCHSDLYSLNLSPKGVQAHEYYMENVEKIKCINCHITVGHYHEEPVEEVDYLAVEKIERPSYPPYTGDFVNYTEILPDTSVAYNMIAIPGGTFLMGSPETEGCRNDNEVAPIEVTISPFWMGEIEVSWREYDVYYSLTSDRGKDSTLSGVETATLTDQPDIPGSVDAVTGPTPPYGSPDQGWGKGSRPAITMTHHAAVKYCEWLSEVTGKKYRLPTEAEWEYACRAGTAEPYYFEGDPEKLTRRSWKNKLFGTDTTIITQYAYYAENSSRTQLPYTNEPNPWGLYNMLGNVKEFCLDWYTPDLFSIYRGDGPAVDPIGPASGEEHVVRGGSYNSDPADLRSASRDQTYHNRWLLTDPQSPKSIWWYSDVRDVGFRVVRECEDNGGNRE